MHWSTVKGRQQTGKNCLVTELEKWCLMPCSIHSWNLSINVKNKVRNVFQTAITLANSRKQESYVAVLYFKETSVGYFDIIYSMPFDWIKLFIHGTNKCTFDIYKYSLMSLLYVSSPWGWHDTKTCWSYIRLYVCI